jgi:anti-sigma regulatory factor (Ser/Thr protein kinase)
MREISLHIMDIIQNSVEAGATFIEVEVTERSIDDSLKIKIQDNGRGIDAKMLPSITDPFTTSRTSRRVGLGLSLFESACIRCSGSLAIDSRKGCGTTVKADMKLSHIDRAPIGRIEDTIVSFLIYPNIEMLYTHSVDDREFRLDTRELKKITGEGLNDQEILQWIREYLKEGLDNIGSNRF